ncbi:MAG TPA: hypothetical protein VI365_01435, partial [Trebonia sp.]
PPVPPTPVPTAYYPPALPSRGQPAVAPPPAPPFPVRQPTAQTAPAAPQAPSAQSPVPPLPSRRPGRQQADGPGQPGGSPHLQGGNARGFNPESSGLQESGSWFSATRATAATGPADPTLPSAPGPVTAPELTTRTPQAGPRPPRFEPPDHRDDQDLADPGFGTQGYQAPGYPQAPDFGERPRFDETRVDGTRLHGPQIDSTRLDQAPPAEPKWRSGRKKDPVAKGGPVDPTPTLVDQPRLQDMPVYQTGMQLVVPAGPEWTFRDPGTGAFPGVRPDRFGDQEQQDRFGDQEQHDPNGWGGRGGPATFPPPGPRGQWADGPAALQPGAGPDTMLPAAAGRKRGRKAPLLIGVGAAVVVLGIGAAVAVPRFLRHTDPGCTAYTTSALPAYNQTITDLNAQASQATLASDLTTAIAQLSSATGQAQGATAKSALQGLLTQLTQVQADTQKGSVPAATVTQLNTAAVAADNACGSS